MRTFEHDGLQVEASEPGVERFALVRLAGCDPVNVDAGQVDLDGLAAYDAVAWGDLAFEIMRLSNKDGWVDGGMLRALVGYAVKHQKLIDPVDLLVHIPAFPVPDDILESVGILEQHKHVSVEGAAHQEGIQFLACGNGKGVGYEFSRGKWQPVGVWPFYDAEHGLADLTATLEPLNGLDVEFFKFLIEDKGTMRWLREKAGDRLVEEMLFRYNLTS